MREIEFFFDISSPWTYLAFSQIEKLATQHEADLIWKPILVGGVFNAVNQQVYETRASLDGPKFAYQLQDLQDWAAFYDIEINWPSVFPLNAVKLMRGAVVAQQENLLPQYAAHGFAAYWGAGQDLSQTEPLAALAEATGLDRDMFLRALDTPEVKQTLRTNTDELIARGGFGSPSFFVNRDKMFFGNDRLPLLIHALQSQP
ncbi:MAG: 2-hydroxychromene-2-carboxylate isomerase [Parvibaculales bacterium]